MDKNATHLKYWQEIGFGFAEVGTVTPKPQPGNPKPRLFRLAADRALINRMGFNNDGVVAIARRLEKRPDNFIVGANLGKNKDTADSEAANDYLIGFKTLADLADYFVINVSSPNTPGLRGLQAREPLRQIILPLQAANIKQKPLLVKIAPDLTDEALEAIFEVITEAKVAGIIATNTTIQRSTLNLKTPPAVIQKIGAGGLSGLPIAELSNQIIKKAAAHAITVIGVGGIDSVHQANEKLAAGATLIQIYTGLVYAGPKLVQQILSKLHE
jgi:dihydroorotate dehydrogenase